MVNIVKIEGHEYIIDTGYGAPILEPMPADQSVDYKIIAGNDVYILNPRDQHGKSKMTLYKDGVPRHGYLVSPLPKQLDDFHRSLRTLFVRSLFS